MLRTVTLELLRHGPAHNQLLSPLTPYLALCGDHDAETIRVDFEHLQLMQRIRALGYQEGARAAHAARMDAAERIASTFGQIRALSTELGASYEAKHPIVHLRLVLSASELALIPYELMNAPSGFPGQGAPLFLQNHLPITLTRRARRVEAATLRWPDVPRILVVAAQPDEVPPVPLRAHLLALRRALDPWLVSGTLQELERYITVLPRATLAQLLSHCAQDRYTHVHVLAHGIPTSELGGLDLGFKLAFHDETDPSHIAPTSGEELAAALCPRGSPERPVVVTVASCDSGHQGAVLAPGASVAHQLHEAGIPFVLASQFPLSVRGSAILCEKFYTQLLRGADPAVVVHDLRRELRLRCKDNHDWASLVAYAALPPDLGEQVQRARLNGARRALDAAMAAHDTRSYELEQRRRRLEGASHALLAAAPVDAQGPQDGRVLGMLATASKRLAQLLDGNPALEPDEALRGKRIREELVRAREYYHKAFRCLAEESWTAVQYLSLCAVLNPPPEGDDRALGMRELENLWTAGLVLATENANGENRDRALWGQAALVELFVIAQLLRPGHWAREQATQRAEEHLVRVLALDDTGFEAYASRRQLLRYAKWWWRDRPDLGALPAHLAQLLEERGVPEGADGTRPIAH